MEPIAAQAFCEPRTYSVVTTRLLHFVGTAPWSDRDIPARRRRYAVDGMRKQDPVTISIVDDAGFLKQGKHSVGVQRQYRLCGQSHRCQIGVRPLRVESGEAGCHRLRAVFAAKWTDARSAKAAYPDCVFQDRSPKFPRSTRSGEPKLTISLENSPR
ncbi:MAG: transposase [Polyangiaceae bacterium]|nr:transposase [Polyangiaceae bacterium]